MFERQYTEFSGQLNEESKKCALLVKVGKVLLTVAEFSSYAKILILFVGFRATINSGHGLFLLVLRGPSLVAGV